MGAGDRPRSHRNLDRAIAADDFRGRRLYPASSQLLARPAAEAAYRISFERTELSDAPSARGGPSAGSLPSLSDEALSVATVDELRQELIELKQRLSQLDVRFSFPPTGAVACCFRSHTRLTSALHVAANSLQALDSLDGKARAAAMAALERQRDLAARLLKEEAATRRRRQESEARRVEEAAWRAAEAEARRREREQAEAALAGEKAAHRRARAEELRRRLEEENRRAQARHLRRCA